MSQAGQAGGSGGGGGSGWGPVTITNITVTDSPYTVLSADEFISADATGGAITIRLPNTTTTGRIISVKDSVGISFTNNITITTVGGAVTIDGSTSYVFATNYESVNIVFDGSKYLLF